MEVAEQILPQILSFPIVNTPLCTDALFYWRYMTFLFFARFLSMNTAFFCFLQGDYLYLTRSPSHPKTHWFLPFRQMRSISPSLTLNHRLLFTSWISVSFASKSHVTSTVTTLSNRYWINQGIAARNFFTSIFDQYSANKASISHRALIPLNFCARCIKPFFTGIRRASVLLSSLHRGHFQGMCHHVYIQLPTFQQLT